MKITKSLLAQIIKEELENLSEDSPGPTEDPHVNELIGMLDFTIEMKVEELKEDYPDKYTAAQMAEAMKWLINHHWDNPPEELTGQAALQEVGGSYQTPIEDIEDLEHARDQLRHMRSRGLQKSIDLLLQRFPELDEEEPIGKPKE